MNTKLNNRLLKISDFVYQKDKVIDIGCDHGLLGIYLVLNKQVRKMISSDINEMPLEKAKENIFKYHLEDIIETRLGNGLACVSKEIDTVIISGMGGLTINQILKDIKNYPQIKKIILSPNSDFPKTRKVISKLGFCLDKETIVLEKGKYYLVSCYLKGKGKKLNYKFGKLDFQNNDVRKYYEETINKNNMVISKLGKKYLFKKVLLKYENFRIRRKLKK